MNIYNDIYHLPAFERAVITIGTFDGVHRGHRQILSQLTSEAERVNGTSIVITFYPHPKQVIDSGRDPLYLLTTPAEKYKLLQDAGVAKIIEVPFTREFSEQTPENYIRDFLVDKFRPHTIIIGYDHHFGKNRIGDFHLLEEMGAIYDFKVTEIPGHILKDVAVSSTRIRQALLAGNIEVANEYLGYPYFFHALVSQGNKIGRTLGFPTANLLVDHERKLLPAMGVYAVITEVPGVGIFKGMMNSGMRPTVDGTSRVTEVHLFDFNQDIYGNMIKVSVLQKIRNEMTFDSLSSLQEQLHKDKTAALLLF